MRHSLQATRGMAVAPHALASQSALAVLRDGGNAVEAMIAAAATIAVAYPHMNSIGGDGFWTISVPGQAPVGIEAAGTAASDRLARLLPIARPCHDPASRPAGRQHGRRHDLRLGRRLCLCARKSAASCRSRGCSADAIHYAREGVPVTESQAENTRKKLAELIDQPGFRETYTEDGRGPGGGRALPPAASGRNPGTPRRRGAGFLLPRPAGAGHRGGSGSGRQPGHAQDLAAYRARRVTPLHLQHSLGDLYNMTPPTQGLVSLIILALLDRLDLGQV